MNSMKMAVCAAIFASVAWAGEKSDAGADRECDIRYYTEPVTIAFTDNWSLEYAGVSRPIAYSGREDLRAILGEDGVTLPVYSEVRLVGEVVAEDDGEAVIGVGADWWWTCSVNGEEVIGRLPTMPDGNQKTSFEKTDWIFMIPVVCGTNSVELSVVLGETGIVAIGRIEETVASDGIPTELERSYRFYKENFPPPESVPFKPYSKWNGIVTFRTAQPFAAGLEYRLGDGPWHEVWDKRPSRRHRVRIPICPWLKCVYRPIQRVYYAGWQVVRGEEREWE